MSNCLGYCDERDAKRGWCSDSPLLIWPSVARGAASWEAAAADVAAALAAQHIAAGGSSGSGSSSSQIKSSASASKHPRKSVGDPHKSTSLSNACLMFDSDSE